MKKTLLTLIAFILGLTAFSQIPNYVPQNGLVGWWPFNGNANDESGNGNNGTVNGATLTTDRFGNNAQAYAYDGIDDRIEIAHNQTLNCSTVSISVWFNTNNFLASNGFGPHLLSKRETSGWGNSFQMNVGLNQAQNSCWADWSISGNGGIYYSNSTILNTGNWFNLVYTHDGTNVKLFLNGALVQTIVSPGLLTFNTLPLWFGARPNAGNNSNWFNGKLDDIGIWNRALTECEIQDLYHAQLNSASLSISAGADQSICAGDNVTLNGTGGSNYQWNNNVVDGQAFTPTQSNAYIVSAQDSLGCTGTDTVVVTVLENATSTLTETSLDSYTLNGQTYTQSGTYTQTLTAANGCDSTITLNLTLNFTGIDELGSNAKKLVKITDLNGKTIPRRKNTLMLFIYEDGTVERVVEMEE